MFIISGLKTVFRKPLLSVLLTVLLAATSVLLCLSLALSAAADIVCQNLDSFYTTVATLTPAPVISDYDKGAEGEAVYEEKSLRYRQLVIGLNNDELTFENAQMIDRRWRMAAIVRDGQPVTVGMQETYIYNDIFDYPNNRAVLVVEKLTDGSTTDFGMPVAAKYRVVEVVAAHGAYIPLGAVRINQVSGGGDFNPKKWKVGEKYLVMCEFDDHAMDPDGSENEIKLCFKVGDAPREDDPSTMYAVQNDQYEMVDGVWTCISGDYIPVVTRLDTDTDSFWNTEVGRLWKETTIPWVEQSSAAFLLVGTDQVKSHLYFVSGKSHLVEGRYITDDEYEEGAAVCMISAPVAKANGWMVGDSIHLGAFPVETTRVSETLGTNMSVTYLSHSLAYQAQKQAEIDLTIVGIYRTEMAVIDDVYYLHPNTIVMPKNALTYDSYSSQVVDSVSIIIANKDLSAFQSEVEAMGYGDMFQYIDQGYSAVADMLLAVQASAVTIRNICFGMWIFSLVLMVFLFFLLQKKTSKTMYQLGCRRRNIFVYVLTQLAIMGVIAAGIGYWGSISLYEKLLSRMLRGELAVFDQSFTAISTGDGSVEEVMEYLVQSPEVFMEIIGLQFIFVAVVFIVSSIFFALRKHSNRV